MRIIRIFLFGIILSSLIMLGLFGCGGGGGGSSAPAAAPPPPTTVQVSWTANRETAVNSPGGGYKVYYSSIAGFAIPGANVVDVPYVAGTAPTSTTLTLASGTHHIKVIAYSALNSGGSAASTEIAITVP